MNSLTTQDRLSQMYGNDVVAWLLAYGYLGPDGEWILTDYRERVEAIDCAQECIAIRRMTYGEGYVADKAVDILRAHHALMKALEHIDPRPVALPIARTSAEVVNLCLYRKNHGKTSTPSKS